MPGKTIARTQRYHAQGSIRINEAGRYLIYGAVAAHRYQHVKIPVSLPGQFFAMAGMFGHGNIITEAGAVQVLMDQSGQVFLLAQARNGIDDEQATVFAHE
jgi:hypothetical protein